MNVSVDYREHPCTLNKAFGRNLYWNSKVYIARLTKNVRTTDCLKKDIIYSVTISSVRTLFDRRDVYILMETILISPPSQKIQKKVIFMVTPYNQVVRISSICVKPPANMHWLSIYLSIIAFGCLSIISTYVYICYLSIYALVSYLSFLYIYIHWLSIYLCIGYLSI